MKTMKFSIKALMAMLLFCLPMVISSCGGDDDDDDNTPKTYTFSWAINSTNPKSSELAAVEAAYENAWKTVGNKQSDGKLIVRALTLTETELQVANRVEQACNAAHTAIINSITEWESSKITVTAKGGKLNFSKSYGKDVK
ncbi:MAG: hypothetical protein IKQ03_00320 [Prevotella sp.]|jgi:hypothetical protein|nr:hypothetical protein [Prevotella sp.]